MLLSHASPSCSLLNFNSFIHTCYYEIVCANVFTNMCTHTYTRVGIITHTCLLRYFIVTVLGILGSENHPLCTVQYYNI